MTLGTGIAIAGMWLAIGVAAYTGGIVGQQAMMITPAALVIMYFLRLKD